MEVIKRVIKKQDRVESIFQKPVFKTKCTILIVPITDSYPHWIDYEMKKLVCKNEHQYMYIKL